MATSASAAAAAAPGGAGATAAPVVLDEDDAFEEFETEFTRAEQADEDKRVWTEDWDDDDVDDEFARQLRTELTRSGHVVVPSPVRQ